ncbi:hypothetical protein CYMTET_33747, partial [Cymbomonas tetramitiformis]
MRLRSTSRKDSMSHAGTECLADGISAQMAGCSETIFQSVSHGFSAAFHVQEPEVDPGPVDPPMLRDLRSEQSPLGTPRAETVGGFRRVSPVDTAMPTRQGMGQEGDYGEGGVHVFHNIPTAAMDPTPDARTPPLHNDMSSPHTPRPAHSHASRLGPPRSKDWAGASRSEAAVEIAQQRVREAGAQRKKKVRQEKDAVAQKSSNLR